MNIKILFITLLIAGNSYSSNDLLATEAAINALTLKIVEQDKIVAGMVKRLHYFINSFKDDKKSQMKEDVIDGDLNNIYLEEVSDYIKKFFGEDKPSQIIFDPAVLGKDSALLKFYVISLQQQEEILDALIREWALQQDVLKELTAVRDL